MWTICTGADLHLQQAVKAFALSPVLVLQIQVFRAAVIEQSRKTYLSEDDVSSTLGSCCGACHSNANIGFLQSRRIIHPITCTCHKSLFDKVQGTV